ncbi:hypothetical protein HD553DRAFT_332873 [Filobasidium floriforme]|uniref:uncharacterized protein n=1 Tax=Filobasidium floriforme TaxID=5210 RepID=UPI001E8D802C|nr:uncharacterized protein HD553DRAFT_332873 [Filobasidium floriforme]KAH8090273.1 hypothetical protein HD553DRAFT_332873 [Filobasidium floriforme]
MSSQEPANNASIGSETIDSSKATTGPLASLRSFWSSFATPDQSSLSGNTLPDPGAQAIISVKLCQKPTGSSESASPPPDQTLLESKVLSRLSELFNGLKDASTVRLEKYPLTIAWWQEARVGRAPVYFLCLDRENLAKSVRNDRKPIDQVTFEFLSKGLPGARSLGDFVQLWGTGDRAINLQTVACELKKNQKFLYRISEA